MVHEKGADLGASARGSPAGCWRRMRGERRGSERHFARARGGGVLAGRDGRADERHAGGRSGRDAADLNQFAARTQAHRWLDAEGLAVLEPDLGGRFARALFFEGEAHLDPRGRWAISCAGSRRTEDASASMPRSIPRLEGRAGRGLSRLATAMPRLRSVRGEMAIVRCPDVDLSDRSAAASALADLRRAARRPCLHDRRATMVESEAPAASRFARPSSF